MSLLPPLRLTGGLVLADGALRDSDVSLADGRIVERGGHPLDLRGYWVLPGIVDVHGDGFERHLTPRPTAPFDKRRALVSADGELAVNGITTAWFAQSWSWEGGTRGPDHAEALLAALSRARGDLIADIRVQIRFETHVIDDRTRFLDAVRRHGVDCVVFNNHLPEGIELAREHPFRFASWAAQQSRTAEQMLAIVTAAAAREDEVPGSLALLSEALTGMGVALGSHDDTDAATRTRFRSLGARICEFPTTRAAAVAAKDAGEPVVMGAPNVVRGGSQAGNIAAMDLVADGLCDALVSDYYYPALAQAVWTIADLGVRDFAGAWDLVSGGAARVMGLADRGALTPGLRADLVVINPETRRVEATIAGGRLATLSGGVAARLMSGLAAADLAAQ